MWCDDMPTLISLGFALLRFVIAQNILVPFSQPIRGKTKTNYTRFPTLHAGYMTYLLQVLIGSLDC